MSKKIDIDSCDTLSDHAKQAILVYPEMKKLHSASMINKDVIQFIKDECGKFDGQRPMVIVTMTVSDCFDTALLLDKVLGSTQIQTAYPHTLQKGKLNKAVVIAPIMSFQLTTPLINYVANASSILVMATSDKLNFISTVLKPVLNQLNEDVKVLTISPWNDQVSVEVEREIVIQPKASKGLTRSVVIELEPEEEPESTIEFIVEPEKESTIEFIVEPASDNHDQGVAIQVETEVESEVQDDASKEINDELLKEHHIVLVDRNYKRSYLRNRLKGSDKKTLIVTRTRHNAHRLEEYLYQGKVRSRILHANLSEEAKDKVIERFTSGDLSVLLLPEVVAQAIDLTNVDDIIFFDLPDVGVEFKNRIALIGERFNVQNTSSIVTLDETPWVDAMEEELKWTLPKVPATAPQRSHNILRIKNRTTKDKPEQTEKRVGRGLRKLGGKNTQQKKRPNQFQAKQPKDNFNDQDSISHMSDDPFNSVNQSIVNENRNPFAFDSFEASVSRQNKKRVKQFFSRKDTPMKEMQNDFNVQKPEKKNVKIVHRKKRTFDIDGNQ